ncbi:MAG: hypothetical protein ABI647_24940, partial [Gemmatimonadota bacterium]
HDELRSKKHSDPDRYQRNLAGTYAPRGHRRIIGSRQAIRNGRPSDVSPEGAAVQSSSNSYS